MTYEEQYLIDDCIQKVQWIANHPGITIYFNGAYLKANQVKYVDGIGITIAGGTTEIPDAP